MGPSSKAKTFVLVFVLVMIFGGVASAQVTRYAIVAGNNFGLSRTEPLQFAEQDASRMAELLEEIGGVKEENLVLLQGGAPSDLTRAFDEISTQMDKSESESIFVFYYSGHSDSGYLRMGGRGVSLEEIRRRLELMPAKVRIAILDACQSGEITRSKGGKVISPFMDDRPVNVEGLVILTSASAMELAHESEALGSSYFSHHLMSGLRGAADTTGDGRVSAAEAYYYAYQYTVQETEGTTSGVQHPTFLYALKGEGDVAITAIREGRATAELPASMSGTVLFFNQRNQVEAEIIKKAGAPIIVALYPSKYQVRWRNGNKRWVTSISLEDGQSRILTEAEFMEKPLVSAVSKGDSGFTEESSPNENGPKPLTNMPLGHVGPTAVTHSKSAADEKSKTILHRGEGPFAKRDGARFIPAAYFGASFLVPGFGQGMDAKYKKAALHTSVWLVSLVGGLACYSSIREYDSSHVKSMKLSGAALLLSTAFYTQVYSATDALYSTTQNGPGSPDFDELRIDSSFNLAPVIIPRYGNVVGGIDGGLGAGYAIKRNLVIGLRNINVIEGDNMVTVSLAPEFRFRGMLVSSLGWSVSWGAILQGHFGWGESSEELEKGNSGEDDKSDFSWAIVPYIAGSVHYFPSRSISLDFGLRSGISINSRRYYGEGAVSAPGALSLEYLGGFTWYI